MALIGADVHANGLKHRPIPRSRSPCCFVRSYVRTTWCEVIRKGGRDDSFPGRTEGSGGDGHSGTPSIHLGSHPAAPALPGRVPKERTRVRQRWAADGRDGPGGGYDGVGRQGRRARLSAVLGGNPRGNRAGRVVSPAPPAAQPGRRPETTSGDPGGPSAAHRPDLPGSPLATTSPDLLPSGYAYCSARARSRLSARCCATRTAPGDIPSICPVSSAVRPTATRSTSSSR